MKKLFYLALISVQAMACTANNPKAERSKMELPLNDMSSFQTQAGNWRIVGDVLVDPRVDVHVPKDQLKAVSQKALSTQPGKGIVLNINDDKNRSPLTTQWEHGDIELELDIMLPKGSNSGVYLQGLYEVQLRDSWGVDSPKYSDIGGIYKGNKSKSGNSFRGKAPLSNAAKAPGLWQHMEISFRAPRFDTEGKKVANAHFDYVKLNGVVVQNDVDVVSPTGGKTNSPEVARAPLVIQGDHGPVALRNIHYKHLTETDVALGELSYKIFNKGNKSNPISSGKTPTLSIDMVEDLGKYNVVYSGDLIVGKKDNYQFTLHFNGGGRLDIDGKTVIDVGNISVRTRDFKGVGSPVESLDLDAGKHKIEVHYYKNEDWRTPGLGLTVQGSASHPVNLNDFSSMPPKSEPISPRIVKVGSEPRLLRAFLDFQGETQKRFTHTIGVGDPTKVHYAYDLESGNIACAWRGEFADATAMWRNRGDGSFRPLGATQCLFNNQPLAFLNRKSDAFPTAGEDKAFRSKGYEIDENTNRPVFNYLYQDMKVNDRIYPAEQHEGLVRELNIENRGKTDDLYFKLGEGSKIVQLDDTAFAIDDHQYYIKLESGQKGEIRTVNKRQELFVELDSDALKYSIIW